MAEQFLDGSQVGPTVKQMSRCRVPEPVRTDIREPGDSPGTIVHDAPYGPLVDAPTPRAEQQR